MILTDILAKSNGENIIDHSNLVVNNVESILTKYNIDSIDKGVLIKSANLHDIGKVLKVTQDFFKNKKVKGKIKFLHNVIGWYFIIKYLKDENRDKIANLVLWHHGNNTSMSDLSTKISDIRDSISDSELELMFQFCKYYNIEIDESVEKDDEIDETLIKNTKFSSVNNLYRSILVTGDVCASANKDVNSVFNKFNNFTFDDLKDDFKNSDRTKKQIKIINSIKPNNTTSINAPTGFGKTVIGVLFSLINKEQLIWVCPTNVISKSIYENIINVLSMMGLDISVELYLTSKREKSNNNLPEFSSDIIVTNIDNFTKPSVSNSYGERSLMIYESNVIFDEVHQYSEMNCALFASFNNIMDKRHNLLNSTTLLLTATPTTHRFLLKNGKEIEYLPSKNKHYKALHDKKYKFFIHKTLPNNLLEGEFVFFNRVVEDVQNSFVEYLSSDKLISHGRYLDVDKDINKNLVLENYSKYGERKPLGVFTNQILTTGCDYSVNKIITKCPTILEFNQIVGRLNRFGLDDESEIHIITEMSQSDKKNIGSKYSIKLQELFIEELQTRFIDNEFTLDLLYEFYNYFVSKHIMLFNDDSRLNLAKSKEMLENIYPKNTHSDSDIKIANSNKMRKTTTSDEVYIIVDNISDNDKTVLSFNISKFNGTTKTFEEDKKTLGKQIKFLKSIGTYNKYKDNTYETMFKNANNYETPYPVFNHKYCKLLGLIKI